MSTLNNTATMTMMNEENDNARESLIARKKKGLMISAAAIIPFVISATLGTKYAWADYMIFVTIVMALISYVVSGGIRNILSIAKKWMVFGWLIFPFPYDIASGLGMVGIAFICFIYFPFAFVLYDFIKSKNSI